METLTIKIKKGEARVKLIIGDRVIKFTYPLATDEITSGDLTKLISVVETLKR